MDRADPTRVDPLRGLRLRVVVVAGASCAAVLAAGAWLGSTVRSAPPAAMPIVPQTERFERPIAAAVERGGLDLGAFNAAIWVVPAKPPEAVKAAAVLPPAPPPPLKLQLIGLETSEGSGSVAVLFDPDAAKVLRGGAGDKVGRYVVRGVDTEGVMLEDDEFPGKPRQTLRMKSRVSLQPGSGGLVR